MLCSIAPIASALKRLAAQLLFFSGTELAPCYELLPGPVDPGGEMLKGKGIGSALASVVQGVQTSGRFRSHPLCGNMGKIRHWKLFQLRFARRNRCPAIQIPTPTKQILGCNSKENAVV